MSKQPTTGEETIHFFRLSISIECQERVSFFLSWPKSNSFTYTELMDNTQLIVDDPVTVLDRTQLTL